MLEPSPSRLIIALLAAALTAGLFSILLFGTYTDQKTVSGRLVPSEGIVSIAATASGTISRVYVSEGDLVTRGQVLLEVSNEQDESRNGDTRELIGKQLNKDVENLRANVVDQKQASQIERAQLAAQLQSLNSKLGLTTEQLKTQNRQISGDRALFKRIATLAEKGYVSQVQLQQQKNTILEEEKGLKATARAVVDLKQQIGDTELQLERLPLDEALSVAKTQRAISDLKKEITENDLRQTILVKAPRDGIVSSLLVHVGQIVRVNQGLLSIVPRNTDLIAELLVPSEALGSADVGARVLVRYAAFPYQKYGQEYGTILTISRTPLDTNDSIEALQSTSPLMPPYYRVTVGLDGATTTGYRLHRRLRAGMKVDASIRVDRRRIYQWLFEPMMGYLHRMDEHQR